MINLSFLKVWLLVVHEYNWPTTQYTLEDMQKKCRICMLQNVIFSTLKFSLLVLKKNYNKWLVGL